MPGKKAFGAKFGVYAGGVLTNVAQITKISPFKFKGDVVDVTSHDSSTDGNSIAWREKVGTINDAGGASLDLNYDPNNATHASLSSQLGVVQVFKVTFPSATPAVVWTISGIITDVGPELPFDNKMTATIAITFTGVPAVGTS
jgi:hypothetical protein